MYSYNPAAEYIHQDSVGNKESCIKAALAIQEILNKLYDNNKIEGWQTNYIDSFQKLEEKLIFIDYDKVTKGQFPFLHARVQVKQEDFEEIDKLIRGNGFVQVIIS